MTAEAASLHTGNNTGRTVASAHSMWTLPFLFCLFLFLPPSLTYLAGASSFAIGTSIALVLVAAAYFLGFVESRPDDGHGIFLGVVVTVAIGLHLFTVYFFRPLDIPRAALSLVILGLAFAISPLVRNLYFFTNAASMDRAIAIGRWVMAISLIFSALSIQPPSAQFTPKPTFPFTEPSFLAFTAAPILIYTCVRAGNTMRIIWLASMLAASLIVSNLTMLAVCLMAAAVSLRTLRLIVALFVAGAAFTLVDISYFQERLELSASSDNLTALVYVQGWQLIEESMRNSFGWGIGYQQLGVAYTNVPASYQIFRLMGFDVNILDGGFLFAKITSELGVIGATIIAAVTFYAVKAAWRLRQSAAGQITLSPSYVLAYSSIYGSIIEIFARGTNYFTGTTVLLTASFWFIFSDRKKSQVLIDA